MEPTYRSLVVAGVRLSEVFKVDTKEKKFYLFGKRIPMPDSVKGPSSWPALKGFDVIHCPYNLPEQEDLCEGVDYWWSNDNYELCVVGKIVAGCGPGRMDVLSSVVTEKGADLSYGGQLPVVPFSIAAANEAREEVIDRLHELGCDEDVDLFLVCKQ